MDPFTMMALAKFIPSLAGMFGRPSGTGSSGGLEGMAGLDYGLNPLIPKSDNQSNSLMPLRLGQGLMSQGQMQPMQQPTQMAAPDFRQQQPPQPQEPTATSLMMPEWLKGLMG